MNTPTSVSPRTRTAPMVGLVRCSASPASSSATCASTPVGALSDAVFGDDVDLLRDLILVLHRTGLRRYGDFSGRAATTLQRLKTFAAARPRV
jgi:hypothetical protein